MNNDYELQTKLEELIKLNSVSKEPIDFFLVLKELEADGIPELAVRRGLKRLGFIITDYGALQKVIP